MKNFKLSLIIVILVCMMTSCNVKTIKEDKPEIETLTEYNTTDYDVTKLFTVDGITVYRFYDRGSFRYFTSTGEIVDNITDDEEDDDAVNTAVMVATMQ